MTQFDQTGQNVLGIQQNAGGDIHNNIMQKPIRQPLLMLPPRAQSFVGREEDLAWLLQQLADDAGKTVAICGPGGMGKTALAAEALSRLIAQENWSARFPDGIFYHSFYTYPSLAVAFEELARLFDEDPGADPRRAAIRALSRRRALLVEVLDDARPLQELSGKNIVLLLSRRQSDALDLTHRRTLTLLSSEQGLTLLQKLADSLTSNEQHMFLLLGLLASAPFPLELVQDTLELSPHVAQQILGKLVNLSVLRRPDLGYEVSHPLVHTFATERLSWRGNALHSFSPDTIVTWRERILTILVTHFDQSNSYDVVALTLWQPHVESLLSAVDLTPQQYLKAARLFNAAGFDAFTQGKYAEAEPLWVRALEIREQELGEMHPDTAQSLNNLAALYRAQGKYAEAEPLLVRALVIYEQVLGSEHPTTQIIRENYISLLRTLGRDEESRRLEEGS